MIPKLVLVLTAATRLRRFLAPLGRRNLLWAAASQRPRQAANSKQGMYTRLTV